MTDARESVHAAKLLELGFTKLVRSARTEPMTVRIIENESDTEKSQPTYVPPVELPCFLQVGGLLEMTMATDELGETWVIRKLVDLTTFGFSNAFKRHPLQ